MSKISELYKSINLNKNSCKMIDYFQEFNQYYSEDFNENTIETIKTFLLMLRKITSGSIPAEDKEKVDQEIIKSFKNIKNIAISQEATLEEEIFSFLKNVYDINKDEIENKRISDELAKFSIELDNINIIFSVKNEDNELMFPLANILKYVLDSDIQNFTEIGEKEIGIILLSLSVFHDSEKYKENVELKKLLSSCNIRLFDFIDEVNRDKDFIKNLVENGLIVIPSKSSNAIYIRSSKSKDYFKNSTYKVQTEVNIKGEEIAWYIVKEVDRPNFISAKDIIKNMDSEYFLELLTYIIEKSNFNIFTNNSFYLSNKKLYLTNEFTANDKSVIIDGESDIYNSTQVVDKLIEDYRYKIFLKSGSEINCVTFGFIAKLILTCKISINDILKTSCEDNSSQISLQEEILVNYIEKGEISLDDLIVFITEWINDLDYTSDTRAFQSKKIVKLKGFYPIKFSNDFFSKICTIYFKKEEKNVLIDESNGFCEIQSKPNIKFNQNRDLFLDNENNKYEQIDVEKDDVFNYFVESNGEKYIDNSIEMLGKLQEKIEFDSKAFIPYHVIEMLDRLRIDRVFEIMDLQKEALCFALDKNISRSFYLFRVINHLIYYSILSERAIESFIDLICNRHDIVCFSTILDSHRKNLDDKVLLLTKDHSGNDSTAQRAISDYCKSPIRRNNLLGFSQTIKLDKKDGIYYLNGMKSKIEKIEIVFDLSQTGTSTKSTLVHYFGKPNRRRPYIMCDGEFVSVIDICKSNNCRLNIEAFAASDQAKQMINEYCEMMCKEIKYDTNYLRTLNKKVDDSFIELWELAYPNAKQMYGELGEKNEIKLLEKGYFPVIREYNQPKLNVFPNHEMYSEQIFNILVCKPEIT